MSLNDKLEILRHFKINRTEDRTNYILNASLNRSTNNDTQFDFLNFHSIESFYNYINRYYQ